MTIATSRLPGGGKTRTFFGRALILLTFGVMSACGGGGSAASTTPATTAGCDPDDPGTSAECGTVLIGLTDDDGDFLNYTLDVVSLTLEMADGRKIETLPLDTRIDFTSYVDMTELVTAATVPPGTYVSGKIRLDYTDSEIYVEAGGLAKEAVATDLAGVPLTQAELNIVLPGRDQLVITRGRPALLQLDFDLAASHIVDVEPTPATAASEPFIVAEVHPVDEKDVRVRGPLVEVIEDEMAYIVAIRPFHDRNGDFGRVKVHVTDRTEFEVNEDVFFGADGLRALAAAGTGIPTVARGTLHRTDRRFTAEIVLAGSSVPGIDRDAVVGNVIKRDGNFLTVRGATIIPSDRRAHFHDDVVVEVGPNTRVFKDHHRDQALGNEAISIGQRVTIRGNQPAPTTDAAAPQVLFDATEGSVRLHVTHLLGTVRTVMPEQTNVVLHAFDRRRASIFTFAGTGPSEAEDADPNDYEIATGSLALADFAEGKPIVAYGFPTEFGTAPPDFRGRTVIDYTDVRSVLGVGWGADGTPEPFLAMNVDGLVLNNGNGDIDQRHHIKHGPVLIDFTSLDNDTMIVPRESGRMLFVIKTGDSLRQYADFGDFVEDLAQSLVAPVTARSMYVRGKYDVESNVFTAYKIGVLLLEP